MTPGLTLDAFAVCSIAVCSMMTFQSVTSFAAAVPIGGHKAKTRQQTRNAPGAAAMAARIAAAAVGIITPSLAIAQFTGRALAHPRCIANAEVPAKKEVGYLSAMPADSTTAVRSREDSACPAFDDSC